MAGYDAFDADFFRDCPYGGRAPSLPIFLRVPLAAAKGTGAAITGLLFLTLRLMLHFGISTALLLLVVFVALGADKEDLAALDPRPYLEALSDPSPLAGRDVTGIQQSMAGLTDGKTALSDADEPPSIGNAVARLMSILPGEQQSLFDSLTPLLREYDALLGDTEGALSRRTADAMLAVLQPWLEMAERDAARHQTPYAD